METFRDEVAAVSGTFSAEFRMPRAGRVLALRLKPACRVLGLWLDDRPVTVDQVESSELGGVDFWTPELEQPGLPAEPPPPGLDVREGQALAWTLRLPPGLQFVEWEIDLA